MRVVRFLSFALSAVSLMGAARLPEPILEKLDNGLQLAWYLDDRLPLVDLVFLAQAGYRNDSPGKSGTTSLLSALLDRGAGRWDAAQFARAVEELGASRSMAASDDTISIGLHGLQADSAQLLELLGAVVLHPRFDAAEADREKARLLERWQHVPDYGDALASLAYSRVLTRGTSYGRGSFWSEEEFRGVTLADVKEYHREHFVPRQSILMIVGRVDRTVLKEQIRSVFGNWGTGDAGKVTAPTARTLPQFSDSRLPSAIGQILLIDRPGLAQASVRMGFQASPFSTPDRHALAVGNALLGETFTSRLNSIIRDQLGLTYSIGSSFGYSKDFASFTVQSATRGEAVGKLLDRTAKILQGIKQGDTQAREVESAKQYLMGSFPVIHSTLSAIASRWLSGYVFGLGPDFLNDHNPKIQAVKTEDVVRALKKEMTLDRMVTVVVGDAQEVMKGLTAEQKKRVKPVTLKQLL